MFKKPRILFITILLAIAAICGVLIAGCDGETEKPDGPQTVAVEQVTLNKSSLTLEVGGTETLTATVSPNNATNKTVSWTSSAEAIATVSNGKVTAVAEGNATITATAGGKSATCTVTVNKKGGTPTVTVESVTFYESSITLDVGGWQILSLTILPFSAANQTVNWTSSAEAVATVADGKVTAVAAGTAVITATVGGKSATCTVTVNQKYISVEGISLNKTELTLEVGSEETLTVIFNPANATDKSVKWTSQNKNVATVEGGKITAVAEGSALIIADVSQFRVACTVTVVPATVKADSVTLNKAELNLETGDEETLTATVLPAAASDKTVTWSSSNDNIASVDANGNVTAKAEGSATITVKTANNKTATCTVTVTERVIAVESLSVNKTALTLEIGGEAMLTATVLPDNATNKTLIWTSSAEAVATVENGKVTAVSEGTATITVKSANNITATCEVKVTPAATKGLKFTLHEYTVDGDIYDVSIGTATDKDIVIPAEYNGKPVKWIARSGFQDSSITSIVLPDTITSIGEIAFSGCKSLTSITLPQGLRIISYSAFAESGLTGIELPDGLADIYNGAFNSTAIESVTIPGSVETIYKIFNDCKQLKNVVFEEGVVTIIDNVFDGSENLESITVPASVNKIYFAFNDCPKFKKVYISDMAAWCGIAFDTDDEGELYCSNPLSFADLYLNGELVTELVIPETVDYISNYAFYGYSRLTGANLQSKKYVGMYAFGECKNLTSVTVGENIYGFEEGAFSGCTGITSITLPADCNFIGVKAFENCSNLKTIIFEDSSYTSIWDDAFAGCSIENVALHSTTISSFPKEDLKSVTITGGFLAHRNFVNCTSLTSVTIDDSISTIDMDVFEGCTFTEATGPSLMLASMPTTLTKLNVTSGKLDKNSWIDKLVNLTDLTIGSNVTEVDETRLASLPIETATVPAAYATKLPGAKLKKLVICDGETIARDAFKNCTLLESVTIPASITSIGDSAFNKCAKLKEVHITDLTAWCNISFGDASANPLSKAHNLYLNGELVTDLIIPNGVTKIKMYAFNGASCIKSVTLHASVTEIANWAFSGCRGIAKLNIASVAAWNAISFGMGDANPLTVTTASNFELLLNGELVTDLVIPADVTSIGRDRFYSCSKIKSVTISDGVTSIGDSAFSFCSSLTSVVIPATVTSISSYAFQNCVKLDEITFKGNKTQWNAITKGDGWNSNTGRGNSDEEATLTVHCDDGDIVLHPSM